MIKVAAWQAPLDACYSARAIGLAREQTAACESLGVDFLCLPEGMLGGLADHAKPNEIAVNVESGELERTLEPLASNSVTTIVGFTEIDAAGRLFNSAAVYTRGHVTGIYRKLHPAINRSLYSAGTEMPVFTVGGTTFGIVICRDSVFPEIARHMASQGATVLFVPTNNGMPISKGGAELVSHARSVDVACAAETGMWVVRADVSGQTGDLASHGASAITSASGVVVASGTAMQHGMLVADIPKGLQQTPAHSR